MGIKIGGGILAILALFLISKTVTEVISWGNNSVYPAKTISISAEGETFAIADIATFTFAVNEEGATSDEAQKKATEKINKAVEYLKNNGIEEKDIKTENYSIYPKYDSPYECYMDNCAPTTPRIVGYTVYQNNKVKVRNTENVGKILSELTKFQINDISGITFTIDDTDALYDLARKDAVEKAEKKAESLAKELGVKLGDVVSFGEDTYTPEMDTYGMGGGEMGRSMKVAPNLSKGENRYTTRVYVTYELE